MIDIINEITKLGPGTIIICIVLVASLVISGKTLWGNLLNAMDLKTGKSLREKELNERLDKMDRRISDVDSKINNTYEEMHNKQKLYHDQSVTIRNELKENQTELKYSIKELRTMLLDKEIDDMRWELLNFANAVINGRKYNKEQYDHVIDIYTKYEKVLAENGLENGRVTSSMEFVQNKYKELMETGF